MMALMIIIALYNLVTLVTAGHSWSHLVTSVTVKVRDLNNDGLDVYYGYMASNKELVIRARVRNASLIDLLASPQVKNTDSSS